MRTIRRTMAAGALALPLTLGAAGIASADSFGSTQVQAGPDGAATHSVQSGTHRGGSTFHENSTAAGPDGVATSDKAASADRHGGSQYRENAGTASKDGVATQDTSARTDRDGGSQYRQHTGWAGQDGAGSSDTHANTGDHDRGSAGVLSGTLDAIGL
ncbi:hypothetical protein H4696_007679 [Amycolatopsis lexingtonensis]|uniref:Uncharacterized protein n=1 Tax=Amycolatopsis lexingtonensis TaxID=218822 RepID=A0ABR9IBP5_9PSEU|nr:hypothetical protein [Amycolatopsis lexingtonensis]MBE1500579.1 hypothetical protein [Amycolatopsis lexingtonensis]